MDKKLIFGDEEIVQIEGFPSYGVSNKGYIYKNFNKGLLPESYKGFRMRTYKNKKGYHTVQLSNRGKRKVFLLHRLVAKYFLPNEKGYKYVIHKDGNKDNNSVDNLQWSQTSERKGNEVIEDKILQMLEKGYPVRKIAKELGISESKVRAVKSKREVLTVYILKEEKDRLLQIAKENGYSLSQLLQQVIKEFLNNS
ncbi:MAG: helix-turn-helix domain-containing protein [Aquificae bacterium]|nr:helix-turn-helix domain-containing protein [Aquificota bacterium]